MSSWQRTMWRGVHYVKRDLVLHAEWMLAVCTTASVGCHVTCESAGLVTNPVHHGMKLRLLGPDSWRDT